MKNQLVEIKNNQIVTSTLQVAKTFGKEHRNVMRDVDSIIEKGALKNEQTPMFMESTYEHPQNHQSYRIYYMNRDGFSLLVMGFTGKKALEFKLAFIEQFNAMQKEIENNQPKLPNSPQEITKVLLQNMDANNEDIKELKSDMKVLKSERSLSEGEYNYIARQINKKVYAIVDDQALNQEQTHLLFKDINGAILELTGVKFRSRLQIKHFEQVRDLIDNWYPSTQTVLKIREIGRQTELDV